MDTGYSIADLIEESHSFESAGNIAAAAQRARQAVEEARAAGPAAAIADALNALGFVQFRLGHYEQARALANEAARAAAADSSACVGAMLLLGMCATETNDLQAGEDLYLRAIDAARELGDRRALLRGFNNLAAGVYMPRGRFDLALAAAAQAIALARDHGSTELLRSPLILTAWVWLQMGRRDQASASLDELRCVSPESSAAYGYYACEAAVLALDEGQPDQALANLERALAIGESTGEPSLMILSRLTLSRYHRLVGETRTALDWADQAVGIASHIGYQHFHAVALIERAVAAWANGRVPGAEADLNAAIDIATSLAANFDLARARFFLALLLHERRSAEAGAAWKRAARAIQQGDYAFLLERERAFALPLIAEYLDSADSETATVSGALASYLQRVPAPPLHIVGLGGFRVEQKSRPIPDCCWRKRRAGELFRLLLVSPNHTLTREQIVDSLWRGRPTESTLALFHQATSALRRALEPELPDKFPSRYLETDDGQVALHIPVGSSVDLECFERRIDSQEWDKALELYQGELFPIDRYAEWAVLPRERLRRLHLRALLVCAHRRQAAGLHREALDLCHRILEIEPWQEEAVLVGMKSALALHDRAAALRLYRDLEQTLNDELDTCPQAELRLVYQTLLQRETSR